MFIFKLHAFLIKSFRALLILPTGHNFLKKKCWYNIMIKVHQHALINLVYSYMVTKVFNIQPVLFHQYYLCHLLWFKKQSFTLVWKPNPPLCSVRVHLRARADAVSVGSTHEALPLKVHLSTWSVLLLLLLQCAVALQRAAALEQQTMHLHKCDHVNFFTGGGSCN